MKESAVPFLYIVVAVLIMSLKPPLAKAWLSDPKINSHIAPKQVNQFDHAIVADGVGGVIVAWVEKADGDFTDFDIWAQRLDSHGDPAWPQPVQLCDAPGYQGFPQMVSDGTGGAIVVWHDSRGGWDDAYGYFDIYAQRISRDGEIMWPVVNGVPISTADGYAVFPRITTDGFGGAFISWDDGRSGNSQDYVQRIADDGTIMWQQNGVIVADLPYGQSDIDLAYDGQGGVIVVFDDYRALDNIDIYVQRFDEDGNRLWSDEAVAVAVAINDQFYPRVISDGQGGAIISWTDGRLGPDDLDIYMQRISASGTPLWPLNGLPITGNIDGSQITSHIVTDNMGGAIVVWEDGRKLNDDTDIYAQKVSFDGVLSWGLGGKPVASTQEVQILPTLIADGTGGAFIAWMDFYRGGTWWNVYAQHLDSLGEPQWKVDGIAVSTADETQSDPKLVSDGAGGMIAVWFDGRFRSHYNVFAQQVDRLGLLGGGEFRFYTAGADGFPKSIFAPGEVIQFKAFWTVPVPSSPGSYSANSAMVTNSGTLFRTEPSDYEVISGE